MHTAPTAAAGGTPLSNDRQLAYRYALASKDMEEAIDYLDCYAHLSKLATVWPLVVPFALHTLWKWIWKNAAPLGSDDATG